MCLLFVLVSVILLKFNVCVDCLICGCGVMSGVCFNVLILVLFRWVCVSLCRLCMFFEFVMSYVCGWLLSSVCMCFYVLICGFGMMCWYVVMSVMLVLVLCSCLVSYLCLLLLCMISMCLFVSVGVLLNVVLMFVNRFFEL